MSEKTSMKLSRRGMLGATATGAPAAVLFRRALIAAPAPLSAPAASRDLLSASPPTPLSLLAKPFIVLERRTVWSGGRRGPRG